MNHKASNPFHFYTRQNLTYLSKRTARNLRELFTGIQMASSASIYHHTHRFLQQHEFLSPEPPNDFAYWISNVLQDEDTGERIASIDFLQLKDLESIRSEIVRVLEESLASRNYSERNVPAGMEFRFMEAQTFVLPSRYIAEDLVQFRKCLGVVSVRSIYYHAFEARLLTNHGIPDFYTWISHSLKMPKLARQFLEVDPYTQTLNRLRIRMIHFVEDSLRGGGE